MTVISPYQRDRPAEYREFQRLLAALLATPAHHRQRRYDLIADIKRLGGYAR